MEEVKNGAVLIDTYNVNDYDYVEDFRAFLEGNEYVIKGKGTEMEGLYLGGRVTYWEWLSQTIGEECQEFWNGLEHRKKEGYKDYCVVTGSLGLWNGRRGGICTTFDNLYDALAKCSTDALEIVVSVEDGAIHFDTYHHDGVNHFEIYVLGYDDYNKVDWWEDTDGNVFDFIKKVKKPIYYEMFER